MSDRPISFHLSGGKFHQDPMDHDNNKNTTDYIISQNKLLLCEVELLKSKVREAEVERDKFEEENESYQKRIISLRGITFNEYQMSQMLEGVVKGYKNFCKERESQYMASNSYVNTLFQGTFMFYLLTAFLHLTGFIAAAVIYYTFGLILITSTYNERSKLRKIDLGSMYSETWREYQELRKNQDYVSQLIDSV